MKFSGNLMRLGSLSFLLSWGSAFAAVSPGSAYMAQYLPSSLVGSDLATSQKRLLAEINPGQKSVIAEGITMNNDADGLSISGTTKTGKQWAVSTDNIGLGGSLYQVDLDKNGAMDYVVLAATGACGIAPTTRLTLLMFNSDGIPMVFELVGYFEGGPRGVADIFVQHKNGEQFLIAQQLIYSKVANKDRNYWRWHLYKAKNGLLTDQVATINGTRFPLFVSYTNKANHQSSNLSSWLEQQTKSQHAKLREIPVQLGN